jgi:hypothetical protein
MGSQDFRFSFKKLKFKGKKLTVIFNFEGNKEMKPEETSEHNNANFQFFNMWILQEISLPIEVMNLPIKVPEAKLKSRCKK